MTAKADPAAAGRCDVLVVGAGLAGSAAAIAARAHGLRVLMIERAASSSGADEPIWLGPAASGACQRCGVSPAAAGAVGFEGVHLYAWDLASSVVVHDKDLKGWLMKRGALRSALRAAAQSAGAALLRPATVARLQLGETCVTADLHDGQRVTASVLVIADGADSATARAARLIPPAAQATGGAAHISLRAATPANGLKLAVGVAGALRVATIVQLAETVGVTLFTGVTTSDPLAQLAEFLKRALSAGVVRGEPTGPPRAAPALGGLALELESHVGKRCLLVGDAGGFASAFSHEGIYPALRSGELAAATIARALQRPVLQDELALFSADWRADLADYLRMPNTDLGLLLPMVFGNRQMSRRLARAFLLGQGF